LGKQQDETQVNTVMDRFVYQSLKKGIALYTFIGFGTLLYAGYSCPLAQEYTDAFNAGGAEYDGITITAKYEDVGGNDIQHDTNPPKRTEGVLLRVNSPDAYPNNSATLAMPDVTLEHYELYTFEYSSAVQFSGDITIYDVDKSGSEHYYDAVSMWYEDTSGTIHPLTAVSYGDSGSLIEFDTNIGQQPVSTTLMLTKGYSVDSSGHSGSSDPKGLVNYGDMNGTSVKKLYIAYWNNYDGTDSVSGYQGVRFCAPLSSSSGGRGSSSAPKITLYKYVDMIDDTNANGLVDEGDVVHYGFKVVNTGNVDLKNITIDDTITTVQGGPLAQLLVSEEDNTTFTAQYTITDTDVSRGGIENRAIVTAQDSNDVNVTDISDTLTDPDGNPVIDPDTNETANPFQINTNDVNDPTDDPTTVYTSPVPVVVPGAIQGHVYVKQSSGSLVGLAGVEIKLYDEAGNSVAKTKTKEDGSYSFKNLTPGDYVVVEIQPDGYFDVSENEGGNDNDQPDDHAQNSIKATVDSGETDTYNDFIEAAPSSLGDRVWYDDNVDGIQNFDEKGVPDVMVYLLNLQGKELAQTSTDTDGKYLFKTLDPTKSYIVLFDRTTLPNGYSITAKKRGNEATDSDVNPESGESDAVSLPYGEAYLDVDMGIHREGATEERPYFIGTHFWVDQNINGRFDEDETGIAGALVELLDANGHKLYWTDESQSVLTTMVTAWPAETQTDGNGEYGFYVPAGTYRVRFHMPENYMNDEYVFDKQQTNSNDNENINTANDEGFTQEVIVGPGYKSYDLTMDAGINCGCDSAPVKSNGADTLGRAGMLLMLLMTLLVGLYFVRSEEKRKGA